MNVFVIIISENPPQSCYTNVMKHFLQTEAWEAFQQAQQRHTVRRVDKGWQYYGIIEHGRLNHRLYVPYGPEADNDAAQEAALKDIIATGRQYGADFVRVDPRTTRLEQLQNLGFRKAKSLQPDRTIINDVTIDHDAILANAKQAVRYTWRKNQKAGVRFHTSYEPADIEIFLDMIHDVAKRTGMQPHSDAYFRQMAEVLFPRKAAGLMYATLEDKPVASLIFFSDGTTMAYAHAASYTAQRNLSPATALVVSALFYAHDTGHKFFDFYGIAPDDVPKDHPWAGFTHFKKSFGGTPVDYIGTWEKPLHPLRYRLYHLYQALYQHVRSLRQASYRRSHK